MAVKIRLRRMGQKKAPFYRVVVADCQFSERRQISSRRSVTYDPNQGSERDYSVTMKRQLRSGLQTAHSRPRVVGKIF